MWSAIFNSLIDRHQNLVSAIRWWFLGGDVLATWMVGVGILWESQSLNVNHGLARRFVLIGVVLETLCSVALFAFDDGISDAQQSKIIALERRLAPRIIDDELKADIVAAVKPFAGIKFDMASAQESEALNLMDQLTAVLTEAGWQQVDWKGSGFAYRHNTDGAKQFGTSPADGVFIEIDSSSLAILGSATLALGKALNDGGIITGGELSKDGVREPGSAHINIGRRP